MLPEVAQVFDDANRPWRPGVSPLESQRTRHAILTGGMQVLFQRADAEKRGFKTGEERGYTALRKERQVAADRIQELEVEETRDMNAARVRKMQLTDIHESGTYYRGGENSYFLDRARSLRGDYSAAERLQRGAAETRVDIANSPEYRAMNTTPGSGGEMAPPLWLIEDFVALARPGRPVADSLVSKPLPAGASSINLPTILTGSTTAVQSTQNTAVSNTDPTTGTASDGIRTAAGFVVISQQDIDQSPISFDEVVLGDLAAAYSQLLDSDVVARLIAAAGTVQTYTDASPSTVKVNQQLSGAMIAIHRGRHMPPDTVAMTPERWGRFVTYTDSQGRPLIVPSASGPMNSFGSSSGVTSEGSAGTLQGLTACVDDAIPSTLGTGNNQDQMLIYRSADIWLYESLPVAEAMPQTYGNQLSVLCRFYRYYSLIIRYPKSIAVISGSGMVPPALGA